MQITTTSSVVPQGIVHQPVEITLKDCHVRGPEGNHNPVFELPGRLAGTSQMLGPKTVVLFEHRGNTFPDPYHVLIRDRENAIREEVNKALTEAQRLINEKGSQADLTAVKATCVDLEGRVKTLETDDAEAKRLIQLLQETVTKLDTIVTPDHEKRIKALETDQATIQENMRSFMEEARVFFANVNRSMQTLNERVETLAKDVDDLKKKVEG